MKKDHVALTPPMGWNSWDCYGPSVNEEHLLGNARYMAEHLKEFGWEYVCCDIQWSEPTAGKVSPYYVPFAWLTLDEYGRQLPAVERFPSAAGGRGFGPIAEKIHGMGLKFGIHIMRGVPRLAVHQHLPVKGTDTTCDKIASDASVCRWNTDMYGIDASKEGAQAYYDSIFELYASWGVDYVKVDDICNTNAYPNNPYSGEKEIEMIRRAIDKCGRPMVLSLSPGPAVIDKAWHLRQNANMWRITDDFWDQWDLLLEMFWRCEVWERQVSPGCWPDCDMLPIGRLRLHLKGFSEESTWTKFTKEEQITMMSLWCIFRSPLIMGGEMRDNDAFTLSLLTNREVLDMHRYGTGAHQVYRTDKAAAWRSVDTRDGGVYVALFNLSDGEKEVSACWEELVSAVWQAQPLAAPQRQALEPLLRENWGGPLIASRGRLLDARQLPGLWVGETGNLLGYLLYHPEGDQWEVALLEALEQGRGVGSALLGAVEELARRRGCKRLWLVTTNDNTHALAFYQRRGFVLAALHRDAVTEARKTLKPSLPLVGEVGIPLRDELELEKRLCRAGSPAL